MARTTLAERMSRLEQQKMRLAEEEARLKEQERKHRTRRLIETGALIEKAGLLELEPASMLGAFFGLAAEAKKPDVVQRWAAVGQARFDAEAAARDRFREALIVSFPMTATKELAQTLRTLGLRWNKVLRHWEGLGEWEPVSALVAQHGGQVRRVHAERYVEAAA